MVKVIFKNMDKTQLAKDVVLDHLTTVVEQYPDLTTHKIRAFLSTQNKPNSPDPDLFSLKIEITGKKYKSLVLSRTGPNFYLAISDVVKGLLERLERHESPREINHQKKISH